MSANEPPSPEPPAPAAPPPQAFPVPVPPTGLVSAARVNSAVLFQIGDIAVTSDRIITPNGEGPLAGSIWVASDQSRTEEKMPAYAVILAIVFFLVCLIGLLFLLIKERKTTGYVEVRVQSGNLMHMTQLPVSQPQAVDQIRRHVAEVQSMAQRAVG